MEEIYYAILRFTYEHPNGINEMMFDESMFFRKNVEPIFGHKTKDYVDALNELILMGYLNPVGNPPLPKLQTYILTDDGRKVYAIENKAKAQVQLQKRLVSVSLWLSIAAALSAVVAALYYGIEICKDFGWCCL